MGKKSKNTTPEEALIIPKHEAMPAPIIDTHCHMLSTLAFFRSKYKDSEKDTVQAFVREYMARPESNQIEGLVDVFCEPPFHGWEDLADSALNDTAAWNGVRYNFVMGVHPHNANEYTDEIEKTILKAMSHPLNVGWGEMGLDYHYDNSPRDVQQQILIRQLKQAVQLGKPLTIHTREADDDIWRILREHVPKDHKLHIHCFTDSPELAEKLLGHFPNCWIGITGVVTYATNHNTSEVIRRLASSSAERTSDVLRLLLETDSPYMTPTNLPIDRIGIRSARSLATCHSGMIPSTAQFIAETAGNGWTTSEVLRACRENARKMYGV